MASRKTPPGPPGNLRPAPTGWTWVSRDGGYALVPLSDREGPARARLERRVPPGRATRPQWFLVTSKGEEALGNRATFDSAERALSRLGVAQEQPVAPKPDRPAPAVARPALKFRVMNQGRNVYGGPSNTNIGDYDTLEEAIEAAKKAANDQQWRERRIGGDPASQLGAKVMQGRRVLYDTKAAGYVAPPEPARAPLPARPADDPTRRPGDTQVRPKVAPKHAQQSPSNPPGYTWGGPTSTPTRDTWTLYENARPGSPITKLQFEDGEWVLGQFTSLGPKLDQQALHAALLARSFIREGTPAPAAPAPAPAAPPKPAPKPAPDKAQVRAAGQRAKEQAIARPKQVVGTGDPLATLNRNKQEAVRLASVKGVDATKKMLERSQNELDQRLRQQVAKGSEGTFTTTQMKQALDQVRTVLKDLQGGIGGAVQEYGGEAARYGAEDTVRYLREADRKFRGVAQPMQIREASMVDRAVRGSDSTILNRLQTDGKSGPGILQRYGDAVIQKFEQTLQQRFLQGMSWEDARNKLTEDSPFLQGAPGSWAERILRTEVMAAHNKSGLEVIQGVEEETPMLKILVATFDGRTGADSYAVHGQIRRPQEAFHDWHHAYQAPPNRPNDREIVVAHAMHWPLPAEFRWKSDAEVAARWREQGNKRPLPSRPVMTTVPLEQIGPQGEKAKKAQASVPEKIEAPEAREEAPRPKPRAPAARYQGDTGTVEALRDHPVTRGVNPDAVRSVFGRLPSPEELERLTGAAHLPGEKSHDRFYSYGDSSLTYKGSVPGIDLARTYERDREGKLVVKHDLLWMDKKQQAQGVAQQVLRQQFAEYDRHGVDRIELDAAAVGRYAWPRMGYEVSASDLRQLKRGLEKHLIEEGHGAAASASIASGVGSAYDIAVLEVDGKRVGKDFLLSHRVPSMEMSLSLHPDSIGRKRAEEYLARDRTEEAAPDEAPGDG